MEESLLNRVRHYRPRAFRIANGEIICRTSQMPPDLNTEVLAYNQVIRPRKAAPVVQVALKAESPQQPARVHARPAIRHPHAELWQACLDRGGPNFDEADELAAKVGVQAALELVRQHGPGASMAALVAKTWGKGGAWG